MPNSTFRLVWPVYKPISCFKKCGLNTSIYGSDIWRSVYDCVHKLICLLYTTFGVNQIRFVLFDKCVHINIKVTEQQTCYIIKCNHEISHRRNIFHLFPFIFCEVNIAGADSNKIWKNTVTLSGKNAIVREWIRLK